MRCSALLPAMRPRRSWRRAWRERRPRALWLQGTPLPITPISIYTIPCEDSLPFPAKCKMFSTARGFLLPSLRGDRSDVIARSPGAGRVIDTLAARGLYVPDVGGDIAVPPADSYRTVGYKSSYRVSAQSAQSE